jgi:hypothetical protein
MLASRLRFRYLFCSTARSATCSDDISLKGLGCISPASPSSVSPQSSRLLSNSFNETRRLIAVVSHIGNYMRKEQPPSKGWQKSMLRSSASSYHFTSSSTLSHTCTLSFIVAMEFIIVQTNVIQSVRKSPSSRMFIFTFLFLHYPQTSKPSTPYLPGTESHSASSDH